MASPDAALLELFGATPSASGISITPRSAMGCAPARCAVEAISEAVGQLPVFVLERLAEGGKERAPKHPAYALLHHEANPWTSASDFKEQATRDCLLHGNSYSFINRLDGVPVELIRLTPEIMAVAFDTITTEPSWTLLSTPRGSRLS
ncbi:MAG: phage portal protein [Xanthobacteraceae bacterium]